MSDTLNIDRRDKNFTELMVYTVNVNLVLDDDEIDYRNCTNTDFIKEAKRQMEDGDYYSIFTLEGFQNAFNEDYITESSSFLRIL